jgi:hypothetical protein
VLLGPPVPTGGAFAFVPGAAVFAVVPGAPDAVLAPEVPGAAVAGAVTPEESVAAVPLLQPDPHPNAPASSSAWPIAELAAVLMLSVPLLIN